MNKKEYLAAINAKLANDDAHQAPSLKETDAVVKAAFEVISEAIAQGDSVRIPGFGTFSVKERAARMGRNPQTKEAIEIPARKSVGFKASSVLGNELNG